jgi:hypothetical protein
MAALSEDRVGAHRLEQRPSRDFGVATLTPDQGSTCNSLAAQLPGCRTWHRNRAVWLIGTAGAAASFLVLLLYGSSVRAETDLSPCNRQIAVEHEDECNALMPRTERAR